MIPELLLLNGSRIPQVGFGTWQVPDEPGVMMDAIDAGYRLLDTAPAYGNEGAVGEAYRRRSAANLDLLLCTKLNNPDHGYDATLLAFERSLSLLGRHDLDVYLIHWPKPGIGLYDESWRAMVRLQQEGRIRTIGVSNFGTEHIDRIASKTGVLPAINQVELHPTFQQRSLREFCNRHGVVVQSWSPLGRGRLSDNAFLKSIADHHGKTVTQVIIRWHVQSGLAVLTRSTSRQHMSENLDVFGFALSEAEMVLIKSLDDPSGRIGHDPAVF
jgi:2,5-diketo-D-gluconate reductase A